MMKRKFDMTFLTQQVHMMSIRSIKFSVQQSRYIAPVTFRQPTLSDQDMKNGCRLGFDTWADTSCAGRHAYVLELCDGKTVTAGALPQLLAH